MFSQEMVFAGATKSGATKSETVEMNQEFLRSDGWRKIVSQVESALCREDRSRQALDQLQQLAAEQGASTQFLLKSVIRETIRLTLECVGDATELLKRGAPSPTVQAEAILTKPVALVLTPEQKEAQEDVAVFTAISRALQPAKPESSLINRLRPTTPKISPAETLQNATQTRESALLYLCNEFRQHRSQQSLSLKQIHTITFIPLHHLQSLEENKFNSLPEDVYLLGFLRRLEKCFKLADGQLSHHLQAVPHVDRLRGLPARESNLTSQFASPSHSISTGLAANLSPNYAYIAYAALMAGGVCWIAQQGSPKSNLPPLQIDTPVSGPQNAPQKISSQQVQQTQVKLTQNIAHPEAFA
jgi:cytoskeleton protein RodZ